MREKCPHLQAHSVGAEEPRNSMTATSVVLRGGACWLPEENNRADIKSELEYLSSGERRVVGT